MEKRKKYKLPAGRALKDMLASFGIQQLRPGQREVIESVLGGNDTLAIMPTGGGKSLCYQIPALVMPGTTVVVSPLISLMKDQVEKLDDAGIEAEQLNSSLKAAEEEEALENIQTSHSEIVFTTPERLQDREFLHGLQQLHIDLFVVDEAHCISQWGHDFRPAYLELAEAVAALSEPPVLALTATATDRVAEDIRHQLGLKKMRVFNGGIFRPNLHYRVLQAGNEDEKVERILQLVRENAGSGIIYTATVKAAQEIFERLNEAGESVALYHGRLRASERKDNQERFMTGQVRVMVATNAFGMGIDKPDTRFVIHFQTPANLEAYYQESGRAGRDGEAAQCILLYYTGDKRIQQFFLAKHYPDAEELTRVIHAINTLADEDRPANLENILTLLRDLGKGKLRITLQLLRESGLLKLMRNGAYRPAQQDITAETLEQAAQTYEERQEHEREALERMIGYAQSGFCRWKVLMEYFGGDAFGHCEVCDNCLVPPPPIENSDAADRKEEQEPSEDDPIQAGSRVNVPKYDEGRVVSVAGDQVTVTFPDNETRTFLRAYVTPV